MSNHDRTFFLLFQGRHRSHRDPQDVQILTLDDAEMAPDKRQTFRREGSAEILELEHDQFEEDTEQEAELNRLPRKQKQALEVLQEELEEDASSSPAAGLAAPAGRSGQIFQRTDRVYVVKVLQGRSVPSYNFTKVF